MRRCWKHKRKRAKYSAFAGFYKPVFAKAACTWEIGGAGCFCAGGVCIQCLRANGISIKRLPSHDSSTAAANISGRCSR